MLIRKHVTHIDHTGTFVQHRRSYKFYLNHSANHGRIRGMTEDMTVFSTTCLNESFPVTVIECPWDISQYSSASVLTSVRGNCLALVTRCRASVPGSWLIVSFLLLGAAMMSVVLSLSPTPARAPPAQNGRGSSESQCLKNHQHLSVCRIPSPDKCVFCFHPVETLSLSQS